MVTNGLLLWIDVQRRTSTANEWKENALKHFTAEEITDAKNMLWDVCEESTIGKQINRQGTSKELSEINDIEKAINTLVEKEVMPLFVATTNMVMRTPQGLAVSTQPALKDIEITMEAVMKKNNAQLDKKHEKVISKSEQGNKKIDDVIRRLETLEHNVLHGNSVPNLRTAETYQPTQNVMSSSEKRVKFQQRPEGASNIWQQWQQPERPDASRAWTADPSRLWNPVGNINPNTVKIMKNTNVPESNRTWAQIVKENNIDKGQAGAENQSWRQKQQVLVGTASEGTQGGCFSADADLVAYNVAKTITTADLCNWLSQRGLFVKDCKLLTTSEEARSLAFKVTIDPKDFDRATKDTSLWPYGVGVRVFKNFNKNTRDKNNEQRNGNETPRRQNTYQGYHENQRYNQGFYGGDKNYRRYGNNEY